MPKIGLVFLFISIMLLGSGAFAQSGSFVLGHPSSGGTAVAHTGTNSGLKGVSPFHTERRESRSQYLYLADELNSQLAMPGIITALAFNVTQVPGNAIPLTNITISIGTTSALSLSATMPAGGSLPVYKTISSLSITETGWQTIQLDTDFFWNGTDNIIVEICKNSTSAIASNFKVQTTQFSTDRTRGLFTNVNSLPTVVSGCNMSGGASTIANVGTISPSTNRRFRPDIKFTFACSGTPSPAGIAAEKNPGIHCLNDAILLEVQNSSGASRLEYQWESSTVNNSNAFTIIPGATQETLAVIQGATDMYYRRKTGCGGSSIDSGAFFVRGVNTWNGTSWSHGTPPTASESAIINGNYTITGDMSLCSLVVNSGNISVGLEATLTIDNEIKVNGGTMVFEDSATLIQTNESAVNTGSIIYKRNSQSVRKFDFTYWSSPVQSQTLNGFSPLTLADKYMSWNIATNNWTIETPSNVMVPGKGYIIRAPQSFPTTGTGVVFNGNFTGIPNNGTINVATSGAGQWNLLGNPYPGSIDAVEFLSDSNNAGLLDGTIYMWTHNTSPNSVPSNGTYNYSTNDYALFNYTGGLGGTGSSSSSVGNNQAPNGFIGAGQSFMIKGLGTGGVSKFKNSMRNAGNNSQFFRASSETQAAATADKHRIWLELTNQQGEFKQILIGYLAGASSAIDRGFDGAAMEGATIGFYSLAEGQHLGIQGRSLPFSTEDIVPLGYKASAAGNQIISMYNYDGVFNTQHVYLQDLYLGITHDFKNGGYNFSTTAGTFTDRFVIRYSPDNLTKPVPAQATEVIVYNNNGQIHIDGGSSVISNVKIFDISGRKLAEINDGTEAKVTFSPSGWNSQILMVQITTENSTFAKKIMFVEKG